MRDHQNRIAQRDAEQSDEADSALGQTFRNVRTQSSVGAQPYTIDPDLVPIPQYQTASHHSRGLALLIGFR
jgi:hypothetical protein